MNRPDLQNLHSQPDFSKLEKIGTQTSFHLGVIGPSKSQRVHMSAFLMQKTDQQAIFLAANEYAAKAAYEDFLHFFPDDVLYLPPKEIMLYDMDAISRQSMYERIETLAKCQQGRYRVLVLSVDAFVRPLSDPTLFSSLCTSFSINSTIDPADLAQALLRAGYRSVETVEKQGEFCRRGGITDVYPIASQWAIRVEFYGDDVDSIRTFDPITQRSLGSIEHITLYPADETFVDEKEFANGRERIRQALERAPTIDTDMDKLREQIKTDENKMDMDVAPRVLDRYLPFFLRKPYDISAYIQKPSILFLDDPLKIEDRFDVIQREHVQTVDTLVKNGRIFADCMNLELGMERYRSFTQSFFQTVRYGLFHLPKDDRQTHQMTVDCKSVDPYDKRMDLLIKDLSELLRDGYMVVIATGSSARLDALKRLLHDQGVAVNDQNKKPRFGHVTLVSGALQSGFIYRTSKFAFFVVKDYAKKKRYRPRSKSTLESFVDVKPDDYVVHDVHGVGRYVGIEKLTVQNIKQDYLKIAYKGNDVLYLPAHQLDTIQKYVGPDQRKPSLHTLGGKDWTRTKKRVKESLKETAEALVALYAKRNALTGHAFGQDTVWQTQFEEEFAYTETDDQMKSTIEIKRDMESEKVMDRLLCGDVGYGKTEVALRAMFKAVMDEKQVAYLVPTTVLANQHYENFKTRFDGFPVKVEMLSRFRTKAQQQQIIKDVKAGVIDVLVGTHRLLSKDVAFRDLGFLVVDEEQRFGVQHKEKIKNDFEHIDVLSLSATPIPRTLHMSLTGIRDISLIEDPPEERRPIQTFVMEYDESIVKDAVYREIARGGQVFYLFNRVRGIDRKLAQLTQLLEGVKIGVAHGQMSERLLEDRMHAFLQGEYDILLCTTIIESGLDMPNVNTLIVENADRMGLSQLYQIRGRVGRSDRTAYAYLSYRKDKILSEQAEKRLEAIRELTDLGAGFRIALKDLEIRGAGNLLGYAQHGHIDLVGYDTYCKLLEQSVREIQGRPTPIVKQPTVVDLSIDAYIDHDFVSSESLRIELYKKIASVTDEKDVSELIDEIVDRFGSVPKTVRRLIDIAHIRSRAGERNIRSIEKKGTTIFFRYEKQKDVDYEAMSRAAAAFKGRFRFDAGQRPQISLAVPNKQDDAILEQVGSLVDMLQNKKEIG